MVILLSALWLAVIQALASSAVPAGGPARAAEVAITVSVRAAINGAPNEREAGTGAWAALHGEDALRPTAPQRLTAVDRTCGRGGPPIRSSASLARLGYADPSPPPACVPPPPHQVSHAADSRGGLLPYYPTPPPLQG